MIQDSPLDCLALPEGTKPTSFIYSIYKYIYIYQLFLFPPPLSTSVEGDRDEEFPQTWYTLSFIFHQESGNGYPKST